MRKFTCLFLISFSFFTLCHAQYSVLHTFMGPDGKSAQGNLTLVQNKLYGMTYKGGAYTDGCIFSVDTDGTGYRDLLDFDGASGSYPKGSLIISGSKLFGMASGGGLNNYGLVFSVDTSGSNFKDLLDFSGVNGNAPQGSLVLSGKKLFGMTLLGGTKSEGNIFSIDTNGGGYTDLLNFNDTNGGSPFGSLTLSGKKLYGMTYGGGVHDSGCVFSVDTNGGGYADLFDFTNRKGYFPYGDLALAANKLYGMTWAGGTNQYGVIFSLDTNGGATYKSIINFNYNTNGGQPEGSLAISGEKMYGMTLDGGLQNDGTVFSVDTNGNSFWTLVNFNDTNGNLPRGSVTVSANGTRLYGMTSAGGGYADGIIFGCDTVGITTSINNLSAVKGSINVYPNPSSGIFTMTFSHPELVSGSQNRIEIYNILGEKVYNATLKQVQGDNNINLTSQPDGVYLYRAISENGNLIGEGKLVVEK